MRGACDRKTLTQILVLQGFPQIRFPLCPLRLCGEKHRLYDNRAFPRLTGFLNVPSVFAFSYAATSRVLCVSKCRLYRNLAFTQD